MPRPLTPRWPLWWAATRGAAMGGAFGGLFLIGVLVVGTSQQSDVAAPQSGVVVFVALIFAICIGVAVGCCTGVVAALAARTAARMSFPPIRVGALAAGVAVAVCLVPLAEMWDLNPATVFVSALLTVAFAAWRLQVHDPAPAAPTEPRWATSSAAR